MTTSELTRDEARERAALIEGPRYRVSLDLSTGDRGFATETVIRFGCREPGASSYLDCAMASVESAELNGQAVPDDAIGSTRIRLDGLQAENEIRVVATGAYHHTGVGMSRFTDPVDGETYVHTDCEPFDAHRIFACFDQPDLKGTFDVAVRAPDDWDVVSNMGVSSREDGGDGTARWTFDPTPVMSTYLLCVVAGRYHSVRRQHGHIDLGLFCRRSLAQYLEADELFEITQQSFDLFERAFGVPYPLDTYDQLFVPEYTAGAMENWGCVTFNEDRLFRSRVTEARREDRAATITHEMAHMWFGDLVTMRWWNDLWLNESFASWAEIFCLVENTRFREAWTGFAQNWKVWAYRQDQLPTTHPIVADVPDIVSIYLNFDGITYAKGASVLKQLVAWVGEDAFLEGTRAYFLRHEYANAELDDFLGALEEACGRDLQAWSKEWLETAGVNTLRPEAELAGGDGATFTRFAIRQEANPDWPTLRSHRIAVGLYDTEGDALVLRERVELDVAGELTEVGDLAGALVPDLVLLNDQDLTFAKVRFDERSLDTLESHLGGLPESLSRAVVWSSLWDMARDAELPAGRHLGIIHAHAPRETHVSVLEGVLNHAASLINVQGDPARRAERGTAFAALALERMRAVAQGSDAQLAWARAFIAAARSEEQLAMARGLVDGTETVEGLAVDIDLRWHIVRSLAAAGAAGEDLIAAEAERDPTDEGARNAAAARAARPDPEAKEAAWAHALDPAVSFSEAWDTIAGFQQPGQEDLLRPFRDRYFEAIDTIWAERDVQVALMLLGKLYPHQVIERETVEATEAHLARDGVPGPVRRLLLEGMDGVTRALRTREADRG